MTRVQGWRHGGRAPRGAGLLELWDDALKSGEIAPAYWALMTHPLTTMPVRQKAPSPSGADQPGQFGKLFRATSLRLDFDVAV